MTKRSSEQNRMEGRADVESAVEVVVLVFGAALGCLLAQP